MTYTITLLLCNCFKIGLKINQLLYLYKRLCLLEVGDSMDGLIWLAVLFLVLALVAYVLGARGLAGFSMEIARWLVIIFVILAIIVFLFGGRVFLPAPLLLSG